MPRRATATSVTAGVNGRRAGLERLRASAPSRSSSAASSSVRARSHAAAETVASESPGGVMSAFCEPATTTSRPHASVSSGTAPRLDTASTTTSAPASRATRASACTSATTPVDVSEWTRTTTSAPVSAETGAKVVRLRRLPPGVPKLVDVRAEGRRHASTSGRRTRPP